MAPHFPSSLRPSAVALVALGGALGTLLRYALTVLIPDMGGFPVAIVLINVSGAFVLGWLLGILPASEQSAQSTAIRLFAGTGVLGGFTTYGTFIGDEDMLIGMADMSAKWIMFGLPTVLAGIAGAWLGGALGRRIGAAVDASKR